MQKFEHEIRDPIHIFVRMNSDERKVLDSKPFQRLRNILQLALTHLVYPGATHKRFEHSLGVMELAGRVFDIITSQANIHNKVREILPEIGSQKVIDYWRTAVRMGALCHDIGHIPFSHAAEEVLPKGKHHEDITLSLIESSEMQGIWQTMTPPMRSEDVAKMAVGPKILGGDKFNH